MAVDHPPVTVDPTEYVSDSQIQIMNGVGAVDAGLRMFDPNGVTHVGSEVGGEQLVRPRAIAKL